MQRCHAERVGDAWHTTGGACEVTGRTELLIVVYFDDVMVVEQ